MNFLLYENNKNNIWGSWIYKGELLVIEIKTPLKTKGELMCHANNIAYGYKEIYGTKVGGFGQSGPCNINVLCPLGNGWEAERNSVALGISGDGSGTFSGSMIMNTCGTNRPFFLTANHVYTDAVPSQNVTGWRFTFQAWSPTCPNPGINANEVTYNGSTLRANWANSDFCLVELNSTPPNNSGINYGGWTRSTTPALNATGIHHPRGDVMKISRANNAVTVASYAGTVNHHWRADWSPQNNGAGLIVTPITEPSSSGSPLFDQNRRIIGQLHGGPSACGGTQLWDFYGRFDLSWTGGGTNATRLSNWLDPSGSNAVTTNTTNVSLLTPVTPILTITGNPSICSGTTVYTLNYNGLAFTGNINWTSSNTSIATASVTGNPTTLTPAGNGLVTITGTIIACGGNNMSVSKQIHVGTPSTSLLTIGGVTDNQTVCPNVPISLGIGYLTTPYRCGQVAGGITNAEWEVTTPSSSATINYNAGMAACESTNNNAGVTITFPNLGYTYTANIRARAYNSCGWSNWFPAPVLRLQINANSTNCGGGGGSMLMVSPNPSTSTTTVEALQTFSFTQIRVYDKLGTVRKQFNFPKGTKKATINISELPTDIYQIQAFDGKEWKMISFSKQ